MYTNILEELNCDRKVNDTFIDRLEKNGFEIEYGRYEYWDAQKYIQVGKERIWLVQVYDAEYGNGCYVGARYISDVIDDIKYELDRQKKILDKENELLNEVLPIK